MKVDYLELLMFKKINIIQSFKDRELIAQITNEKILETKLKKESCVLYCGFDPTADSLHLGHLPLLLCLKRFQIAGHKPIVLIGGATGMIGDPSFKQDERKLNEKTLINQWVEHISKQIRYFLDFNCGDHSAIIVNNYTWLKKFTVLSFLRDIGKYFSVNKMINKEAIKLRFNRGNQGVSFTEFSYNLLQSYDFLYLNKNYNVTLQIGGSDQWGNIISGIELTKSLSKNQVFGLTVPLITKSDGKKIGKTEKNTIWLDPKKTSPYKFYQFFININDNDVFKFLKMFTLINTENIKKLIKKENIDIMQIKYILATQVTELVHGKKGLNAAKRITYNLFHNKIEKMSQSDFKQLAQDGLHTIFLSGVMTLQEVLVLSKFVLSKKQARNLISSNAITVNNIILNDEKYFFKNQDKIFGLYTLLRCGKKKYCLINWN